MDDRLLPAPSEVPEGHPPACRNNGDTRRTTSRQGRRDRRRVRTTDIERTRAPSIGSSRTLRPKRADVAFAIRLRGFRPAPGRLRREGPAPSRAGFSLQTIQPFASRELPRKRLRPERCASPTSATDSPNEHPLSCPIPGCTFSMLSHPWPMTSGTSSGRASLDGDAPASA